MQAYQAVVDATYGVIKLQDNFINTNRIGLEIYSEVFLSGITEDICKSLLLC
jgi:hypothetical protein